ncbi:hypothetical protein BASA60_002646 [Batrachochytrium salamandrivorans]|nr:hypothetical protein BASA60_002646 [Batrachochytrium salamandrivorans]
MFGAKRKRTQKLSVSRQLQVIRDESGIAAYGGASDITVSNYIRICMAAILQKLSEILGTTWAISIAFDCSTHQSRSYLDVRVRFFRKPHMAIII